MLTKKAKYAVHALTYLARCQTQEPVLIVDLSRETRIPRKYLERILLELKTRGVLRSRKGKGGGYSLGQRPEDISIGAIIRLMDGPLAPVSCVSQMAYAPCPECRDEACCGLRSIMQEVRDAMADILDHCSLADLVRRSTAAEQQRNEHLTFEI
jgi:Rrf2 family protein